MFSKNPRKTILFNYKKKLTFYKNFLLFFFFLVLVINLVIYHNFFFIIKQGNRSMVPNINSEDLVFVSLLDISPDITVADLKELLPRGSVIAFSPPQATSTSWWIKVFDIPVYFLSLGWVKLNHHKVMLARLLGYPGEKIEIRNKVVYLDDRAFTPSWVIHYEDVEIFPAKVFGRDNFEANYIDNDKIFLLNDNWDEGNDSRQFGAIPVTDLAGRAIHIYKR